jgi:hypothetical protein
MTIKMLALILILVAAYLGWWAIAYSAPIWLISAATFLSCAIGLMLRYAWAKYLWYAIALGLSSVWIIATVDMVVDGWGRNGAKTAMISLIPGLLLVTLCVISSLAVRAGYKAASFKPGT